MHGRRGILIRYLVYKQVYLIQVQNKQLRYYTLVFGVFGIPCSQNKIVLYLYPIELLG